MKQTLRVLMVVFLGAWDLRAQAAPILRLGGERDIGGDIFARLADVAFDASNRVLILDDADNRLAVVGLDGRLRQRFGRTGGGPGEFRTPTSVAVTASGRLVVFDAQNSRLTHYDVSASDSVRFVGTASMPVRAYDACTIGERIFVLADDGRNTIHEFALSPAGLRRVRSFGELSTADPKEADPRFRIMLTKGHLACAPDGTGLAFAAEHIGQVWTFSTTGEERAHIMLSPFSGIGIELTEGGFKYIWPQDGAIAQVKSVEMLEGGAVRVGLVRLRRSPDGPIMDRYEFRTVDVDGRIQRMQPGSGRFVSRSPTLAACVAEDLVPELRVYRVNRTAPVCQ